MLSSININKLECKHIRWMGSKIWHISININKLECKQIFSGSLHSSVKSININKLECKRNWNLWRREYT